MQKLIDDIIYSKQDLNEKVLGLKKLFSDEKKYVFIDFDDTITTNDCLFFSKYKFLSKYKKLSTSDIFKLLSNNFAVNNSVFDILNTIKYDYLIILTRNNHEFIKLFIDILLLNGIKADFVIWITDDFLLNTKSKIRIVSNSIIVSDIFEYNKLKNQSNFICIDDFNYFKLILLYFKKLYIYIIFILKYV